MKELVMVLKWRQTESMAWCQSRRSVAARFNEARFSEAERPDIGGGGSGLLRLVLGAKLLKSSRLIVVVLRNASRLRSHRSGWNWRQSGLDSCA